MPLVDRRKPGATLQEEAKLDIAALICCALQVGHHLLQQVVVLKRINQIAGMRSKPYLADAIGWFGWRLLDADRQEIGLSPRSESLNDHQYGASFRCWKYVCYLYAREALIFSGKPSPLSNIGR